MVSFPPKYIALARNLFLLWSVFLIIFIIQLISTNQTNGIDEYKYPAILQIVGYMQQ